MKEFFSKVRSFFTNCFLPPKELNWGYTLFVMSAGLLTLFLSRSLLTFLPFSPTSLIFASLIVPLQVLIALIIPAVSLAYSDNRLSTTGFTGKFTGLGPILIGFFSGVPLSLINSACHNLVTYLWLRAGIPMAYPAFMCYNLDGSFLSVMLEIMTQSVIPAIGICIFFTGVLWSLFREENKGIATIIITIAFVLYSLNPVDSIGLAVVGWWILTLRRKTGNIFAPFFALVAMKITEVSFSFILPRIDTTTLQTYSDIPSSYFYSSAPSIFMGIILLSFFKSTLNDFERIYNNDLLGRENGEAPAADNEDKPLPFMRGVNTSLAAAFIIMAVIWGILLF